MLCFDNKNVIVVGSKLGSMSRSMPGWVSKGALKYPFCAFEIKQFKYLFNGNFVNLKIQFLCLAIQ